MAVHRALGPGLLESAYETCLAYEMDCRGLRYERQVPIPVVYRDVELECGYRIDLLVEDQVVVELKAVDGIAPLHEAQLLSYLKLSRRPAGLLINFNSLVLKDGIRRMVNNLTEREGISPQSTQRTQRRGCRDFTAEYAEDAEKKRRDGG